MRIGAITSTSSAWRSPPRRRRGRTTRASLSVRSTARRPWWLVAFAPAAGGRPDATSSTPRERRAPVWKATRSARRWRLRAGAGRGASRSRRCAPGLARARGQQQQSSIVEATHGVRLARVERHQRSSVALDRLASGLDRDAARDDLHDCPLANAVITDALSALKVEHDEPALGRREEHARLLPTHRRCARRVSARLARGSFLGRGRHRWEMPALHRSSPRS